MSRETSFRFLFLALATSILAFGALAYANERSLKGYPLLAVDSLQQIRSDSFYGKPSLFVLFTPT